MEVGQKFTIISTHIWTHGGRVGDHKHVFTLLVECDKIEGDQASWKLVEVLDEAGRPPENAKDAPTTGGLNLRYLDELIENGDVIL